MIRRDPKLKKSILLFSKDQATNYLPLPTGNGETLKRSKSLFTTGNRKVRLVSPFYMVVNWSKVWHNLPRTNKSVSQSQHPGLQIAEITSFWKVLHIGACVQWSRGTHDSESYSLCWWFWHMQCGSRNGVQGKGCWYLKLFFSLCLNLPRSILIFSVMWKSVSSHLVP